MKTYTIKPLKWEQTFLGDFRADTIIGYFEISINKANGMWQIEYESLDVRDCFDGYVASKEDGMARCEIEYRDRIIEALDEVKEQTI